MTLTLQKCLPAFTFFGSTGSGSVSWSGFIRIETADDAVISLRRLLTPCVDSFNNEVTFCVDSFNKSDTVGVHLLCPFKSLLSMLIAKRMEFRPSDKREGKKEPKVLTKLWHVKHFFPRNFPQFSTNEFLLFHVPFTLFQMIFKLMQSVLHLSWWLFSCTLNKQ